jgi:hypothetical protein
MLDRPHEIQPLPPEAIRRLTERLDAMERAERRRSLARTCLFLLLALAFVLAIHAAQRAWLHG